MAKLKNWMKSHKKLTIFLTVIIAIIVLCVFVAPCFVAVKFPSEESYTSFVYTTDVFAMNSVDRMFIKTVNGVTVITDEALIKEVVEQTIIGNSIGVQCFGWQEGTDKENMVSLYNGDKLVRNMKQSVSQDGCWGNSKYNNFIAIKIFENSLKHRINDSSEAWVYLSIDLVEKIEVELNKQGNSYFKK